MKDPKLTAHAKSMRREPTPAEHRPWLHLRAKRFQNAKFRHQQVIAGYIADFACRSPTKLIIELDGDTHGHQIAYDEARTKNLERRGYRVLRFTNAEVMGNLEGVLETIGVALKPSPLQGRGLGEEPEARR